MCASNRSQSARTSPTHVWPAAVLLPRPIAARSIRFVAPSSCSQVPPLQMTAVCRGAGAHVQLLYSEWLMYMAAHGVCEVHAEPFPFSRYQYLRNWTRKGDREKR